MSYSVNFSENTSGKIVLDNVVMNGAKYAPSAVTEVFTKDDTGLLSKQPIDLTKITYAPAGAAVVVVPPGSGVLVPTESGAGGPGAPEGGVPKVETLEHHDKAAKKREIEDMKNLLRYKYDIAGKSDDEIRNFYKDFQEKAAVTGAVGKELKSIFAKRKDESETAGAVESTAFNSTVDIAPPIPPFTTHLPPAQIGGSSRKTKRNRRKNKRFVKKSYKRRR
jgi:hypothetical protein